jgi:outer membrane biosynthesis protein TonB
MSSLKNLKRYRQSEPEAWEQRVGGNIPGTPAKPQPQVRPNSKHKGGTPYQNWLVPGVIGLVFLTMIGFVVKVFMSDSGSAKKAVYQVNLIKPPPDEKVKPPEPEPQKVTPKEVAPTPVDVPQPQAQANDQPPDNAPPPGADLGVAGEGGSGSDGFGLVGKGKNYKGRDVTLGSSGGGGMSRLAMLTKYGWYTDKIQEEIKKQYKKRMDKDGGVPKGKYEITLKILLDPQGVVKKYRIITSSGNDRLDEALKASLPGLKISQAPPDGMPSLITLRIISQG